MRLYIKRYFSENDMQKEEIVAYDIAEHAGKTLLQLLERIKEEQDRTLSFNSDCRSSICGSCAVRVNGVEKLACSYKPNDGDRIEPLRNMPIIRDLIVDMNKALAFNKKAHAYGGEYAGECKVTQAREKINELQSDCILCASCYSACPVYAVNEEFLGPFALTRVWRYVADVRESEIDDKIATVQNNGIWDCTLCNECVPVCPQGIAPKQDIMMLRTKSGTMGYMDPNMANMFGGGLDFGAPRF